MFGHQDDKTQDSNTIPDHEIDAALSEEHHDDKSWDHPGTPLDDKPKPASLPAPAPTPATVAPTITPAKDDSAHTNDLLDIKQQALGELSPLVSHLDQTPEEKFRTLMMMIQASDDQSKIKEAYAAAQAITDEKGRAQALLDVINEINYFTQSQEG
jgi:hypothetical protein